jgi:hypothetical protein
VVDAVAAAEGALVEQAGEILGDGGVGARSAAVLENIDRIRAPGGATDLLENAFPLGEEAFVNGKLEVIGFGGGVEETPTFASPRVQ